MLSKLTRHTPETFKPIVWVLLAISCTLNVLSVKHYTRGPLLDDSGFSYVDDDYPNELPIRLNDIEMDFEEMHPDFAYSQTGFDAWLEWHAMDHFPRAHGFVKLGRNSRDFGVSMFHQIHCLSMIRESLITGPNDHAAHCLNFLRQAMLCNADTTLETGIATTHTCRDFTQAYDFISENQRTRWPKKHNATESHNDTAADAHHDHGLR